MANSERGERGSAELGVRSGEWDAGEARVGNQREVVDGQVRCRGSHRFAVDRNLPAKHEQAVRSAVSISSGNR